MPGPFQLAQPILRRVLGPVFRPMTRTLAALIAIPAFRWFLRNVLRMKEIDEEMEKDLAEWFRGAVVLLFATRNFENYLVGLVDPQAGPIRLIEDGGGLSWFVTGGRLLLAIAVIESMPDQQLFSIIHPGPPPLTYDRRQSWWQNVCRQAKPVARGLACQHLNRSSPVFAIMAAIFAGTVGWVCYLLAIVQYLIIGLVTSRDRAIDVLTEFDRKTAEAREQIIEEFDIHPEDTAAPIPGEIAPKPRRRDPVEGV